ncbi:mRNA-decapping enzyme-like protein isoform X2 [Prosopis cineraria]|uniref:mRNA-decapping enzyme-like protein isoform X2 n=1 Tax=Prosopis cineraria TaxID=364024 RepID=UPI002410AB7A|nr:mRNA-decapping enzyme-like protein isoform X2 [Prosopis cineraria]
MSLTSISADGFANFTSFKSRKDVEGSLFVVKRTTQPRFQFIVMNRRNTENLVENLLGDFEYEVQVPYLLYRNANQEVNGIWFYDAHECEEVATLFNRILNAYSKVPQKSKVSSTKSEFEELEAVPTMAVMDGPLVSSPSTALNAAVVSDGPSFVNFFGAAVTIGNTTNAPITAPPYQSSATIPSTSLPVNEATPIAPSLQFPSHLSHLSSKSLRSRHDSPDSSNSSNQATNLVKPSFFVPTLSSTTIIPPVSLSTPAVPPPHTVLSMQRPYGPPLLQPFPAPTPPPSLTPTSVPHTNYGPVITREKVRDALLVLIQDNQFIDMVYKALLNAHES